MLIKHAETLSVSDFVNYLTARALELDVSDIHLEPQATTPRIRFRTDGLLQEMGTLNPAFFITLISHLKVRAELDIAQKRLPQEGRMTLRSPENHSLDCRVSIVPTLYGEKVALRLLATQHKVRSVEELGMTQGQQRQYSKCLAQPQGLVLLTGPTGCGKTTTVYAGLQQSNRIERNIYTIEDPIEITLPGINQITLNPKIGLDYHAILKMLLRQDPDVFFIGEIRDAETARIAVTAAQTGHLVLSTLHSKSCIDSIYRLLELGINKVDLTEALTLIIAQRLIRKCCTHCLGESKTACTCVGGYHGRFGLFELLQMTDQIKALLWQDLTPTELAKKLPLHTLRHHGATALTQGLTTQEELRRVLG